MRTYIASLLLTCSLSASAQLIDFEGVEDLTPLTVQYSGLGATFSNATVLTAGISLNEFEFPPFSGDNVVVDDGGELQVIFESGVTSLFGYFTYIAPLTLRIFDIDGNEIASAGSFYSDNTVSSGNPSNELLGFMSAVEIYSFTVGGDPLGGTFVLDNFAFTFSGTNPGAVPEPSTYLVGFCALGVVTLIRLRRARRAR